MAEAVKSKFNNNYSNNKLEDIDGSFEEEFDVLTLNEDDSETYKKRADETFTDADALLHFDSGANIFYISTDGSVTTPSKQSPITIYSFNQNDNKMNIAAFIQVDSWLYPLIPNESPIMKTNFGAYLFPNSKNDNENISFIGLTFTNQIDEKQKMYFEDILSNFGALTRQDENDKTLQPLSSRLFSDELSSNKYQKEHVPLTSSQPPLEKESYVKSSKSDYISNKILNGAQYIGKGVHKTSDVLGDRLIYKNGEQIKSKLNPNAQPVNVNPAIQGLFSTVRKGTGVPVKVSSYVTDKLSSMAGSGVRKVATGTKTVLSKTVAPEGSKPRGLVNSVFHIAGSGVKGVGIIEESFEKAAKNLANNLKNETVKVVDHKYGPNVAKLADDSIHSVYNVGKTAYNLKTFRVRKTLAKAARKEVVNTVFKK